jgi:uncharacterized repeat protein (TIGR01451 family)
MRCGASIAGTAPHEPQRRNPCREESALSRSGRSNLVEPVLVAEKPTLREGLKVLRQKGKIATLFGVVVLVMLVAVPIASAWHPSVVASLDCNGTVTFTVTADVQDSSRDNADVAVVDTSGVTQPVATGVFNAADDWSFSGTYTIPTSVTSDTLTPQARGIWGGGAAPSNGPSTTVTRPQDCGTIQSVPPPPPPAPTAPAPVPQAPSAAPASPPPAPPVAATPSPGSPSLTLVKGPATQTIPNGSAASFTIVVTNTGDVPLTNVVVTDALTPTCAGSAATNPALTTIAPGASVTYTCTSANLTSSFTNVATATGTPPVGTVVTVTATAQVEVTAPFLPPTAKATKPKTAGRPPATVNGSTSLATSHVIAPFTPPVVTASRPTTPRPKLVSHAPPKTAG